MESLLTKILHGILNFLRDSHPGVCYATCAAIGKMSIDFSPILQKKFDQEVIPGLLMVMDDSNGRVQDEATEAVITFFKSYPKRIATKYLTRITAKLEAFGWIAAREKIFRIIGPIQRREPQSAIWRSPNIDKI
ncbi:hypothetical protein DAPPUDRAFT_326390 [Daphnia pulex]|uniref:Uncharacterized protein n=1 Tax=Daphnia pulex TaxID=6669 RepID=E9H7L3_DAPPU|nr:hypothetical protein DAPPUDRAFT_326390 [Daphnia pulex]|eukprot:EFX72291.1 hypothetical protein DAPPUDRAFT_326390 [Daphnia pulex]